MNESNGKFRVMVTLVVLLLFVNGTNGVNLTGEDRVLQRLAALETQQKESQNEFKKLHEIIQDQHVTLARQEERINRLERELFGQKAEVNANRKRITQTRRAYAALHALLLQRFEDGETKKTQKSKQMPESSENKDDQDSMKRWQTTVQQRGIQRKQVQGGIAFTAYIDHDAELGSHQTIKFNKVIINDGNGYNTYTGVFTTAEAGVYMFSFSIGQRDLTGVYAYLVVNNVNIIDAVVDTAHATQDLQGGNTAVIRLKQGDSVWVQVYSGHIEGSPNVRITSFTGVYLYA